MVKPLELKGKTFGFLTVLNIAGSDKIRGRIWLCRCDVKNCKNIVKVPGNYLTSKKSPMTNCGCLTGYNLLGKRYGYLTVINSAGSNKGSRIWLCRCDAVNCGKTIKVSSGNLLSGNPPKTHCGCLTSKHGSDARRGVLSHFYKHGQSRTKEYSLEYTHNRRVKLKTPSDDRQTYKRLVTHCLEKHNFCVYCGISAISDRMTIDHILPVSKGGTNDPKNLITACRGCNSSKGKKLFIDWYHSYMGGLNTLEEILDYMGFDSLEHLTNYQNILVHAYQQKNFL